MKKIVIITAMQEECELLREKYNLVFNQAYTLFPVYQSENITLIQSFIGKIEAGSATTFVCENFDFDLLINIGIAGSLCGDRAKIGDVFLVKTLTQHDIYLPFSGAHLDYAKKSIILTDLDIACKVPHIHIHENAHILTGDQFIDNEKLQIDLYKQHGAELVDMEAFAIASVLRRYGFLEKFLCVKAISDGANSESQGVHMTNLDYAMFHSIEVLDAYLKKYSSSF